jgi:hypothetical protein
MVMSPPQLWPLTYCSTNCKSRQRVRPKSKSKATVRQKRGKRKIWSWVPNGCPTPRHIVRLTVGHNINSIQLDSLHLHYETNTLMPSIGLWLWYINITVKILDIIHRPVLYLKQGIPCRCLKQRNANKICRFVRTSQETHYVSATSLTG